MKNRLSTTALLIMGSFLFFSCGNPAKEQQKEENTQVGEAKAMTVKKLPDAAIPIIYKSHLYIKSTLDSVEGYFVFDSGADRLYIDSSFYEAGNFQHENVAVAKLPGVGNKMQTLPLVLDKIELSFLDQQIETIQTPIIQLKPILGDLADGIIGNQLLTGKIMEINYKKEYIIIHDAIDSIDLTGYSMIKCEKIKNRLYIPLELNIDEAVVIKDKFLLDLGSGGSLSLTSPAAQQHNLGEKIKEKALYNTTHGGIGGASSGYDFKAMSLRIADHKINNINIDYSNDKAGALASDKYSGLIGNKILERFDVLLDLESYAIYLKPNEDFNKEFIVPRLGFRYVDRSESKGCWVVKGIWQGSPAEQSGIDFGQQITHVNGTPVSQIPYKTQKDLFKKGEKATFTLKDDAGSHDVEVMLKAIL